jgi:uncharacterized Zn finger protein (UPF0148 family)
MIEHMDDFDEATAFAWAEGTGYEYDDDPTPSVEEIAAAVEKGLICASCGEPFVKQHGHKVACRFCFARMTEAEIAAEEVRLATHDESTAAEFKRRARKRRKQNNG